MTQRIGVTGWKGRLGSELLNYAEFEPIDVDITKRYELRNATKDFDTIVHCAAYTNVDGAETGEGYARSTVVNDIGTLQLSEVFMGRIIYISTDFIFDGRKGPYSENASPHPINHYGKTKLRGEEHILDRQNPGDIIVRTTNLYSNPGKQDFVWSIYKQLMRDIAISVPSNQIGNPTYVPHLAMAIAKLVHISKCPKIINISGTDLLSRYEFALMIASVFGFDKNLIQPTTTYKPLASRPHKGGFKLGLAKKLKLPLRSALQGLEELKGTLINS